MGDFNMAQDSIVPEEQCNLMINMLLKPNGWLKLKCGRMERATDNPDTYTLHFHSMGRLRPWKKEITLEGPPGIVVLNREQCIYVMSNHPETFTVALHWLRETYGRYKFPIIPL